MEILKVYEVKSEIVEVQDKTGHRTFKRYSSDNWEILIGESWEPCFSNTSEVEELYRIFKNKNCKKARIRKGAIVGIDMSFWEFDDETIVFDVENISDDRRRLTAFGYGQIGKGPGSYGNGGVFVHLKDIIPVD